MRKLVPLLALSLSLTYSCKENEKENVDYAVLSGKIAGGQEFTLVSQSDRSVSKTIKLSDDGSFVDTLRVDDGLYVLHDGNRNGVNVYITKGSEQNVTADINDFRSTVEVSGKGSEISTYYLQKSKINGEVLANDGSDFKLDEEAYKAKVNSLKDKVLALLDSSTGISKDFKDKESRDLNYNYLKQISQYEMMHSRVTQNPDFKVSEGYLAELDDVDYENMEDYNNSAAYKDLVVGHFSNKAMKLTDSMPRDLAFLKTFKEINDEKMRNELLYDFSSSSIGYSSDLEEHYNTFMAASTNEEHKKIVTDSYNELKVLERGNPSPKFVDYENYNGGTSSLDDFKGKYVYIDVWATWCGPCLAEIPSLKKIEEQYRGKNIEIISISVDQPNAYDKWREMIAEKELAGVQLLADNNFKSDFVQGYLINGIPRFILIDPEGNIVESNAPRPSNPKLVELFNELNI